jgi:hypothetical protein
LGAGATIAAALNVYMNNAPQLWGAVAVVVVPLRAIQLILQLTTLASGSFVQNGTIYGPGLTSSGPDVGVSFIAALIGGLAELLAIGAVFRLVFDEYRGHPTTIGDSFEFAGARLLSLLWMSILVAVLVAIGFILLVIPGIYLAVCFAVAVPVLMSEGETGFAALRRSRQLVSGRWWATFGRLIVAGFVTFLVSVVLGVINLASVLHVHSVTPFLTVNAVMSAIGSIITVPFTAAVAIVIYVDLRVRKEGIDLDGLDGPPSASGGGPPGYVQPPRPGEPQPPTASRPEAIGGWPRNQPRDTYPEGPSPPATEPPAATGPPPAAEPPPVGEPPASQEPPSFDE